MTDTPDGHEEGKAAAEGAATAVPEPGPDNSAASLTVSLPPAAPVPDVPDEAHRWRDDIHASTLAVRKRITSAHAFRDRNVAVLFFVGIPVLTLLAMLPLATQDPVTRAQVASITERLTTVGALSFLIAAPGYWLGLGHRSLAIAGAIVVALYAATAWLGGTGGVNDVFVVARVLAFLIFGLAGFNLVFVLEEMIYDGHRLLPHRRRGWLALPFFLDAALCLFLPWWWGNGGLFLPTFWIAAMITTAMLGSWWFIRLVNQIDLRQIVIRELHLFAAGILAAGLLADAVQYLVDVEGLMPSLLAYGALLATWVYVSYTTLQRTHLLLRGRNAAPWAAILLAATFAIVAHGQELFLKQGTVAVQDLFTQRMDFMIYGVWIAIAFYAVRGVWRALRLVTALRTLTPRGRHVAQQAARVARGVLGTERVVEQATRGLFMGLDRALPGHARGRPMPAAPRDGWELDADAPVAPVPNGEAPEEGADERPPP